jgi:glutamate-1-semialdehyde 2,1-aminomutase
VKSAIISRTHTRLLAELEEAYAQRFPKSASLNATAEKYLIDGGSHAIRLDRCFPLRVVSAHGSWLRDEDDHDILDFWQGHLANILGHNPEIITSTLAHAFEDGFGLQTGFADRLQVETAEILCRRTGAERVRFTTSGTLATMYATLLARAFTGRNLVMKVGGGWHGAQPWTLKGVYFHRGNGVESAPNAGPFSIVETQGLPSSVTDEVIVTRFNDPDLLRDQFRRYGDQLACFLVEPFIGVAGFEPATREYLRAARELTQQYGTVLVFDEVISGFRFHAGSVGGFYGIQSDLYTFGKIIGGGMPVAAVAGRADILALVGKKAGSKVKFSGGTYSAHPSSLLAAKTIMTYLVDHEDEIYARLAGVGEKIRRMIRSAFADEGVLVCCRGGGRGILPGSSMFMLHFPYDENSQLCTPEDWFDPSICDITLTHKVLDLALMLEDVYLLHGHGAANTTLTDADLTFLDNAFRRVARRIKRHL